MQQAASGGTCWADHAGTAQELQVKLMQAVAAVQSGVSAVLDVHLDGPQGKYPKDKAALEG